MDGLATYKAICPLHPEQKAIIASGFSDSKDVREAQELGVGKFVRKPYTIHSLGIAIHRELQ